MAAPSIQPDMRPIRRTGRDMSRAEMVRQIEQGQYPNCHVRVVNDAKTPVSNSDGSENNIIG